MILVTELKALNCEALKDFHHGKALSRISQKLPALCHNQVHQLRLAPNQYMHVYTCMRRGKGGRVDSCGFVDGLFVCTYYSLTIFIAVCEIGSRLDAKATKYQRVTYFFSPGAILGDRMFTCVHVCCSAIYNDLSLADSDSSMQVQWKKAKPASHKHAR